MWIDLKEVAKSRRLDATKFEEFALKWSARYAIDSNQVNTWHVDQLVEDFKEIESKWPSQCEDPKCMCHFKSKWERN